MQEPLPADLLGKVIGLVKLIILDPFIFSGFASAFLASLFWMAAMAKFPISYAYPFMSSAFVLVMFFSAIFFGESINTYKVLGTVIVILGIIILSQGYSNQN